MIVNILTPSAEIIATAKSFSEQKLQAMFDAIYWINSNTKKIPYNTQTFRTFSAADIFERREVMGCTDVAILFLSFMEAIGITATYIETMSKKSLDELKTSNNNDEVVLYGHVFCRVNITGKPFIVDPTHMQIIMTNNLPATNQISSAVIIAEGSEFQSLGLNSTKDIRRLCNEFNSRQ